MSYEYFIRIRISKVPCFKGLRTAHTHTPTRLGGSALIVDYSRVLRAFSVVREDVSLEQFYFVRYIHCKSVCNRSCVSHGASQYPFASRGFHTGFFIGAHVPLCADVSGFARTPRRQFSRSAVSPRKQLSTANGTTRVHDKSPILHYPGGSSRQALRDLCDRIGRVSRYPQGPRENPASALAAIWNSLYIWPP